MSFYYIRKKTFAKAKKVDVFLILCHYSSGLGGRTMHFRLRPSTYSPTEVQAFFSKYPFLSQYIAWRNIDFIRQEELRSEILPFTTTHQERYWLSPRPTINVYIWLLDKNGNQLYEVGRQENPDHRWWKFWEEELLTSETVEQAMDNLGDKGTEVYHVLRVQSFYKVDLTLYTSSESLSFRQTLETELLHAQKRLRVS